LGTPPIRTPFRNAAKWRFLALSGKASSPISILRNNLWRSLKRICTIAENAEKAGVVRRATTYRIAMESTTVLLAPCAGRSPCLRRWPKGRGSRCARESRHKRSLQSRQHRRLFEETDHSRPVPDQRGRDQRRLWRRSENGIGDLASAQSPVDRVQRWQR
jgi:hypothetical protein